MYHDEVVGEASVGVFKKDLFLSLPKLVVKKSVVVDEGDDLSSIVNDKLNP